MFYEIGLESRAGLEAIQLDMSHIGGDARMLLNTLAMQAEITKTDLAILKRDVQAQYASLRTNAEARRARPLSRERRD
jgi:replication-associated recombination protein RarA